MLWKSSSYPMQCTYTNIFFWEWVLDTYRAQPVDDQIFTAADLCQRSTVRLTVLRVVHSHHIHFIFSASFSFGSYMQYILVELTLFFSVTLLAAARQRWYAAIACTDAYVFTMWSFSQCLPGLDSMDRRSRRDLEHMRTTNLARDTHTAHTHAYMVRAAAKVWLRAQGSHLSSCTTHTHTLEFDIYLILLRSYTANNSCEWIVV